MSTSRLPAGSNRHSPPSPAAPRATPAKQGGDAPPRPPTAADRPAAADSLLPPPPATAPFPLPGPLPHIPLAWLVVALLTGFMACLLLFMAVVAFWLILDRDAQDGTIATAPDPIAAPDSHPQAGALVPATAAPSTGPPAVPTLPVIMPTQKLSQPLKPKASAAGPVQQFVKEIAAEVQKEATVGAPPQAITNPASLLGMQGTLDTLAAPAPLPKGMLPFLRGVDRLHALKPNEAVASFDEAVEADPENSNFYTARGAAYVLSEQMKQGVPDLERAMRLDPRNVLASRLTRLAYLMLGDQLKASKYHGHGGHADADFLITEVGVPYGHRNFAAQYRVPFNTHDQMKAAAAVQKLPTLMRLVASSFETGDEKSSQALYALGVDQFQAGDYAAARRSFSTMLARTPYDWSSRYYYARSLLETGDPELARNELTYVLCWNRFLPEAFAARALCAVRQRDLTRARADRDIVQTLAPDQLAEIDAALANAEPAPAAAEESAAWDRLLTLAATDVKFEEIVTEALSLRRSVDARRRRWDETYQDRLFELVAAARAHPGSADHLAAVAEFLREHHKVELVQIVPNGTTYAFRKQTPETAQWEIELAYRLVEEGLAAQPQHARCWATKSAILLHTYRRLTEAEASAEYAIRFDPRLIAGHMALSDCYKEYAARLREHAAALRAPKPATRTVEVRDRDGNFVRNDSETYYVPASPEDLALAAECDREADVYEDKEQVCLRNALAAAKGTPAEPFYQALMLYLKKDYAGARPWLEKAVAQNPEDPKMRYRLSACLAALELNDEATEERGRAINLQQTTAGLWLQIAWTKLERGIWSAAGETLRRARELDPSDARIAAYQGILEEFGNGDSAKAQAAYVAALAQEEARARVNQTTFLAKAEATGMLHPDDVGLSILLRLKGARHVFRQKPALAAEFYLQTAQTESRLSEWNLAEPVRSAMLPYPERDLKQYPAAAPLVALLKNNRIYAGQALLNAGHGPDAAQQFAAAENFANRLPAGGTAYLEFELEPQYVPFRVSSMPMYAKALSATALLQQGHRDEARAQLLEVRYYLANRTLEQRQLADDPIPGIYERLAPLVGLR